MKTRLPNKRSGTLFILSGPSGVGKTTLRQALQRRMPALQFSISWTTRSPRSGEEADRDYHFVSPSAFEQQIERDGFLEWARVHQDFYGTPLTPIRAWLRSGKNVLLDIDVQGARQVKGKNPEAVTIFILPPSRKELRQRLARRNTESPERLRLRLRNAEEELAHWISFDYAVVNGDLNEALAALEAIVQAQRYRVI